MARWSLRRNKASSETSSATAKNVPDEVKEYYESSERERMGTTWLLAFVTLILTILLALGIFFGGRWLYRKITHKSSPETTTQVTTTQAPAVSGGDESKSSSSSSDTSNTADDNNTNENSNASHGTSSTSTSEPSSTPETTPNTGPGNIVAVFAISSIASGALYYAYQLRRQH